MLNFSRASENNKQVILDHLLDVLAQKTDVLEIGSGSGQHAIFFSQHLPQLSWQPTELAQDIAALEQNIINFSPENVLSPLLLDVCQQPWPVTQTSSIYTANTLHIMPWPSVVDLFSGVGDILNPDGLLCIYGPFKYLGQFTTASNADFDQWLKHRDPLSGIRDFEAVNQLARDQGLSLIEDYAMPANNQLLIFNRH